MRRLLRGVRRGLEAFVRPRQFHDPASETEGPGFQADPDRSPYQPSSPFWLPRVLRGRRIAPHDVLVVLGSGAGLVLCQAAGHPFGRVLGVEISPTLAEAARRNIELNRSHVRCPRVEVATCDAASFELPDDVTYVYLDNPFVGGTFERVAQNILASIDRVPREVIVIYANPQMSGYLEATGRFEVSRTYRDPWLRRPFGQRKERLRVYLVRPAANQTRPSGRAPG
jgi:precorrin-6B methylase 2